MADQPEDKPPMDEAQKEEKEGMEDVVKQATVEALKEFDSGEMPAEEAAPAEDVDQETVQQPPTDGPAEESLDVQEPAAAAADDTPEDVVAPAGENEGDMEQPAEEEEQEPAPGPEMGTSPPPEMGTSPPPQPTEEPAEEPYEPEDEEPQEPAFSPVHMPRREPSADPEGPSQAPGKPVGGGDGGGPPDDDDDDGDYGGYRDVAAGDYDAADLARYDDEEDEEVSDEELVVLAPDHNLMKRAQQAIKKFLEKRLTKIALEHRELDAELKRKKTEREELGVQLYGTQQELAKYQMGLERCHDDFARTNQERLHTEQELGEVRDMYVKENKDRADERYRNDDLRTENENLSLRLHYMKNAKEDVRSDIAVMRRAAEKADTELGHMETDKQRQDLYVDRLVERQDKLKEEIAMYEAQYSAQNSESKAAKEALAEAHMEIEAINLEKKQLFQQWNSSLTGMRRRDEAFAAMQQANDDLHQRMLSLDTETEGYKKSIMKEEEQNEKLTLVLNKTNNDIDTVKRQYQQCQAKHDALKNDYATCTRMLHETEQGLAKASADKQKWQAEVTALRKQIEGEFRARVTLEEEIMERMREEMTMEKASEYSAKITGKLTRRTQELENDIAVVENKIAHDTMEITNSRARLERLRSIFSELDDEITQKNDIISRCETEQVRNNAIVERKQGVIDQYNKKLEQMISAAGGVELGPLEIQMNSLNKSHDLLDQEQKEQQQIWLRNQSELVRLSIEREDQVNRLMMLKKKFTILSQKKIRGERSIEAEMKEISDIEREIRHLQTDVIKLNTLLHKEKGDEQGLEASNTLAESDFIRQLKEAERESIVCQERLDGMKEEKERLLNSVIEAERQIMLWEKKTQLARETRAAVDSEIGQGEIKAMKSEIHRMQVRFGQLMKQQEKMIQEMEKSISRRDTIVTRGDAAQKMNKKVLTKGSFQRQMTEMRKKVKSTIQEAQECDREIGELRSHAQELGTQVEERQMNCSQLQSTADTLDGDNDRGLEDKHKNLIQLLSLQQRTKWMQQLKDGRYARLCKTDSTLDAELGKQQERSLAMQAIVDRVQSEYPHAQPALRKVTAELTARTAVLHGD